MPLRWRTMKPNDVARCAEIMATHPVVGPRYESAIKDLPRSWLRLLGSESMTTAVFEEVEKGRVTLAGVGVGVFVRDEFIRELKLPPQFWFGPELAKRALRADSPCSPIEKFAKPIPAKDSTSSSGKRFLGRVLRNVASCIT